jgi:Domain of unknown function (DU1801)
MAENKTKPTEQTVKNFLDDIDDKQIRADCATLVELMQATTKAEAKMWGKIVGFGQYHYKYESGREGDSMLLGFAPRKDTLTLYVGGAFERHPELMEKLGKHKVGKGCLYIKKLEDVNMPTLKKLLAVSFKEAKQTHVKA